MPWSSSLYFLAAVFFLFAAFGFLDLGTQGRTYTAVETAVAVLLSGGFAMLFAYAGTRRILWMLIVTPMLQVGLFTLFGMWTARAPDESAAVVLHHHRVQNGMGIVALVAGYVLMLAFFNREGTRFFKAHTEIRLAAEIHQALVPRLERRIGDFEFLGVSRPSGEVGGDLVDLLDDGHRWLAYAADVSGHGVSAGVVMAMVKSAVHTCMASGEAASLLPHLNRVLHDLTPPEVFATFVALGHKGDGELFCALAGHLPILHFRAATGDVVEHTASNVPLGILPGASFSGMGVECAPGDLLVLVTDGFTEIFDAAREEFGLERLKQVLARAGGEPLAEILRQVQAATAAFGPQDDDQTILLVRRCG